MFQCERISRQGNDSIRILKCRSLDSLAQIPARIRGLPVTELAPYAFSAYSPDADAENPEAFWWEGEETAWEPDPARGKDSPARERNPAGREGGPAWGPTEIPLLEGNRLEAICLPHSLQKVGAYAFYNCGHLRKLEACSTTLDWGAGVFNGCFGVRELILHVDEERRSCMREILMELRQTLEVLYLPECRDPARHIRTRLIFPEYFEEAVENTPARILVTQTHGCGQRYRNAFVRTRFQFSEYDSLFAYIQVQESEELAARLALGRLMYPYGLEERFRKRYMEYLEGHAVAAAEYAVRREDMETIQWLFGHVPFDGAGIEKLLDTANRCGDGVAISYLMEQGRRFGTVKRRRFTI